VIKTSDILSRLQSACSTDATLLLAVSTLFGKSAVLTLQVGADPMHEVAAQDCPLVAFLDAGPAETGRDSPQWRFPLEIQVYVCDGDTTETASPPTGTRLLSMDGPVALDTLAAALRTVLLSALDAMGLSDESLRTELEPPSQDNWPRQRALITLTAMAVNPIGGSPSLTALPSP
jgi:hypothetical protein